MSNIQSIKLSIIEEHEDRSTSTCEFEYMGNKNIVVRYNYKEHGNDNKVDIRINRNAIENFIRIIELF